MTTKSFLSSHPQFNQQRSHMSLKRTSLGVVVTVAVSAGLLSPIASNAASSRSVTIKLNGPPKGTKISGTYTSNKLGKGKIKGTLNIPLTKLTFTTKGGTFKTTTFKCSSEKVTPPTYRGCWKVTKGTGKFRGMKGSGKLSGNFNGRATYSGKVRY